MPSSNLTTPTVTTLNGVVANAVTGAPIPRALVQFSGRAILTDHDGRFVFSNIDNTASSVSLRVTKPGYYASPDGDANLPSTLTQAQAAATISLRLYPEAVLTGTVTSPEGTPLPRVLVTAQQSVYMDDGQQWRTVGQKQTNSHGEFRIPVSAGVYRIETGLLPRVDGTSKSVIPSIYPPATSGNTSDLLHATAGAEQRVDIHPDVATTYPVPIHIEQSSERGFPMLTARSSTGAIIPANYNRSPGGQGQGQVQLPLGTFTLSATQNMGDVVEYGETTVTVTGNGTSPVTLHLDPVSPIPVTLTVDSAATSDNTLPTAQQLGIVLRSNQDANPMRPASFRVELSRDRSSVIRALPGSYRLTSPASGSWFVTAASYGGIDLLRQTMVVSAGGGSTPINLTISNQTGSLSGTVKLHGVPSSAWVYLVPSSPSTVAVYSVHSTPDGIFTLSRLPKGSYRALAFELVHHDDYTSTERVAPYTTWMQNVTVTSGNASSVDLDAVSASELQP